MTKAKTKKTSAVKSQVVCKSELPFACPTSQMPLWSTHPKVYLPLEKTGAEICPYCGTKYVLKND